jgi:hypothetical protein
MRFIIQKLKLSITLLSLPALIFAQDKGILEGRIYNAKNNEALEFATIAIFGTNIGSISDLGGKFLFTGLKPGYVEIHALAMNRMFRNPSWLPMPIKFSLISRCRKQK